MSAHADLLARLRELAEESRRLWEMVVDTAEDGGHDPVRAAQAAESAEALWDSALDAVEMGVLAVATDALTLAARLGDDWGDGSTERAAMALVRDAIEAARWRALTGVTPPKKAQP